jgi:hypothetical protein
LSSDSVNDLLVVVNRIWQFLEYPLREIQIDEKLQRKQWLRDGGWR